VLPGEELEFEGKIIHEGSGFTVGRASGRRKGRAVCEAQITYRVVPFPNAELRRAMVEWGERIHVPVKDFSDEVSKEPGT
jgi:3-hydroxyacyl-[acyl-carrier-protein] dehydratase